MKGMKKIRNACLHDGDAFFKTSFMIFMRFMTFMLK
jgi:hypothetical protein